MKNLIIILTVLVSLFTAKTVFALGAQAIQFTTNEDPLGLVVVGVIGLIFLILVEVGMNWLFPIKKPKG